MTPIPDISALDVAFGNIGHLPKMKDLPEEFQRERSPFCKSVQTWFFDGATASPNGITIGDKSYTAKEGVDAQKALAAIRAALGSFEPSHEHKIAGCGFLLSEWFDPA